LNPTKGIESSYIFYSPIDALSMNPTKGIERKA